MPTPSHIFRDAYDKSNWIFDLWAYSFDFLNGRFSPTSEQVDESRWEAEQETVRAAGLQGMIVESDGLIPSALRHYIQLPGGDAELENPDFLLRLYCALLAVDRAVADLNYLAPFSGPDWRRWPQTKDHLALRRHQLQRSADGIVAFRPRDFEAGGKTWCAKTLENGPWIEMPERGEHLSNYFQNLLRVDPQNNCELEIRLTSAAQDFEIDPHELRLGIVPLVNTLSVSENDAQLLPGTLRIVKETQHPPTFGVRQDTPAPPAISCAELCDRAEAALRYLADCGAQVVLFPEMVVPDSVLQRIKEVLFDLDRQGKPRPSLTLAGTFSRIINQHSPQVPFNVAVGLNARGEELWRQSKLQPYDMKRHEQKRFGLEKLLDSESCRENIRFVPRHLHLVDSRQSGMRIATLICEDATRDPGLGLVKLFRANLVLAPVMAGPLTNECGFTALDSIVENHDAIFVVANSGALARKAWDKPDQKPPLAMVGIPLVLPTNSYKPHELLDEPAIAPGTKDVQVFYYQLPKKKAIISP
jgi:hypothetical protein